MYRALLGVSKVFVLIEKAMYRTLLVGVWLSGNVGSLITTSKNTNI